MGPSFSGSAAIQKYFALYKIFGICALNLNKHKNKHTSIILGTYALSTKICAGLSNLMRLSLHGSFVSFSLHSIRYEYTSPCFFAQKYLYIYISIYPSI